MTAIAAALVAAAHAYVLPWGVLFLLPSNRESACAISSLQYGPPDGKWQRASALEKPVSCEFRQSVVPGPLLASSWQEHVELGEVSVTYTVQGSNEPQTVTLQAESIDPAQLTAGGAMLSATVQKVKEDRVRAVVTSNAAHPVLLGDVVVKLGKAPTDACSGAGPTIALQRGESLVDVRPGLVSPSMVAWVALFRDAKRCSWVQAATRHK
ncbi:MAG TPA: hypothetical protein VG496_00565 [Myxococcales bacterium]|nr:hypothetical protein [Myxococcales bacterium]